MGKASPCQLGLPKQGAKEGLLPGGPGPQTHAQPRSLAAEPPLAPHRGKPHCCAPESPSGFIRGGHSSMNPSCPGRINNPSRYARVFYGSPFLKK